MLGEFVDDYTVRVVDVFAMPQSGTGVSVEAVDPVFQTKMMDMLRQTNRYNILSSLESLTADSFLSDRRLSSAGTTHILVSAAGCPVSTSTLNNRSNNSPLAPSPSLSTPSNPSRAKSSLMPSASLTHSRSCSGKSHAKPHPTLAILTNPPSKHSSTASIDIITALASATARRHSKKLCS